MNRIAICAMCALGALAGACADDVAGRWSYREGGDWVEVELEPDGRFRYAESFAGEQVQAHGTWKAGDGRIVLTLADGAGQRIYPYRLEGDVLSVRDEDGTTYPLRRQQSDLGGPQPPREPAAKPTTGDMRVVRYTRYRDRSEGAFTLLVPQGWTVEGGILRVDPTAAGGPAQSIEAKLQLVVKKDAAATVGIVWLPHVFYKDPQHIGPAAPQFPVGSNYMGMPVQPYMDPHTYAQKGVFEVLHPNASGAQVVKRVQLPELAKGYAAFSQKLAGVLNAYLPAALQSRYEAGAVVYDYTEGGTAYRESITVVTEHRGALAGQWTNRLTIAARAPKAEFDAWAQVLLEVACSSSIDTRWLAGEIKGQMERSKIVLRTQQEV